MNTNIFKYVAASTPGAILKVIFSFFVLLDALEADKKHVEEDLPKYHLQHSTDVWSVC